jgi:hypothetical protein
MARSPTFSPKAFLEQEDIVLEYADMLMVAIAEKSCRGPLNMNKCYHWITFDGMWSFVRCLNVSDDDQSSENSLFVKHSVQSKPGRPMSGSRQS